MIDVLFFDSTMGLRPERTAESFNNIIYTTQYALGEQAVAGDTTFTRNLYMHIGANQDANGLYLPKASHDNQTYLMLACLHFKMPFYLEKTKFLPLIFKTGILRPWDTILYAYLLAPKPLKWLLTPLTLLPVLQSLHSAYVGVKTRPVWYKRPFKALLFPKLVSSIPIFAGTLETYKLYDGTFYDIRRIQNDGTHLAAFKFKVLKNQNFLFSLGARLCDTILTKKYGSKYMAHIMNNYFPESDHPNRVIYSGIEDFLK